MSPLSDRMLSGGCVAHIGRIHGEVVEVLSGPDAGRKFSAVNETESDQILSGIMGDEDPRARRFLRFAPQDAPDVRQNGRVKTADGKTWQAVRQPGGSFLTVDFELTEIAASDS